MAALPYIQLYVADYLADTAHLSAAQHGAYLLLIFNYWQRGQALCNANERLANVARMSNDEWSVNRAALVEFFEIDGDIWRHHRIEADLAAVATKSTRARAAGVASAAKRASSTPHASAGRTKATSASVQRQFNHTEAESEADADADAEKKGRAARATRLSADWTPSPDAIAFCHSERPDLDVQDVASRFRDYWCAVAGEKSRKVDWDATWRNWVRSEKARQPALSNGLSSAGQATKSAALDWLGGQP